MTHFERFQLNKYGNILEERRPFPFLQHDEAMTQDDEERKMQEWAQQETEQFLKDQ